jgi:hypothetical protein
MQTPEEIAGKLFDELYFYRDITNETEFIALVTVAFQRYGDERAARAIRHGSWLPLDNVARRDLRDANGALWRSRANITILTAHQSACCSIRASTPTLPTKARHWCAFSVSWPRPHRTRQSAASSPAPAPKRVNSL